MTLARTKQGSSHIVRARLLAFLYAAGLFWGLGGICPLVASEARASAPLMVCRFTGKPMAVLPASAPSENTAPCCQTRPALSAQGTVLSLNALGCCVLVQRTAPAAVPPVRLAAAFSDEQEGTQAGSAPLVFDRARRFNSEDTSFVCLRARFFAREQRIRRSPPVSAALAPRAPPRFFS